MIDSKLIAMHQWIVDETEKKPTWWAEQVIWPAFTIDMVVRVLTWKSSWIDMLIMFFLLTFGALLITAARNESMLKQLGQSVAIRMMLLALLAFHIGTLFVAMRGVSMLYVVSGALTVSYYYFAACEAPRPKKRKQLVLQKA